MNATAFTAAYGESRNGANCFVRHPLVRSFHYSDGVEELAKAGCYWLLDVLATEVRVRNFATKNSSMCIVTITVKGGRAQIVGMFSDDDTRPYRKGVSTNLPEGEWLLYLSHEGDGVVRCILPTEY